MSANDGKTPERSGFRPSRPKVVQPKPTNKDAPSVAPTAPGAGPSAAAGPSSRPAGSVGAGGGNGASTSTSASARPAGPKIIQGQGSGSTILVSNTQRGNPVVSCLKNVGWEYSTIPADYQMGVSTCALFLSLKYHQVHPDYLDKRIEKISGMFNLRVLLLMCDAKQYTQDVKDLTKRCLANNITIVMAWTPEQAARYLEQYKILENKGPELIKERAKDDWVGQMTSLLTSIQRVNKTDAMALLTKFGSLRRISQATPEELSLIPGFGEIKVKRLREAFSIPFRVNEHRTFRERQATRKLLDRGGAAANPQTSTAARDGPDMSAATARLEDAARDTSIGVDAAADVVVNANGKRPLSNNNDDRHDTRSARDDIGPDVDFGPEFDLTEEELRELQGQGEGAHDDDASRGPPPAASTAKRAEAIATADAPNRIQHEVANELRNAHSDGQGAPGAEAGALAEADDADPDPIQDADEQQGAGESAAAAVEGGTDEGQGLDGLTEEERKELAEAMAFSMGGDGEDEFDGL